jgi:hypothetical protein
MPMKQRVVDDWLEEYDWPDWMANPDAYVYHAFRASERDIGDLIHTYKGLSDTCSADDLGSEAFIATHTACGRHRQGTGLKLSSLVHWNVQSGFQAAVGADQNMVEIYAADGSHVKTVGYRTWQKQKKMMEAQGMAGVVKRRIIHDPVEPTPEGPDET